MTQLEFIADGEHSSKIGEEVAYQAALATLVKDGEDLKLSEEIACA